MTYWRSPKWIQTCSHHFFTCRPRKSGQKQFETAAAISYFLVSCFLENTYMNYHSQRRETKMEFINNIKIKSFKSIHVHFFSPNSHQLKEQLTSYVTVLLLSCKSGVRKNTEPITSMQNHLSSKRKPQKKRQSFKDNFCEGLRATWTTCDICTNWKSKRGHIGLFFDHLINFPLNALFILRDVNAGIDFNSHYRNT